MNDVQATPHIDDKATCEALNEIVSAYLEDAARKAASEAGRRREGRVVNAQRYLQPGKRCAQRPAGDGPDGLVQPSPPLARGRRHPVLKGEGSAHDEAETTGASHHRTGARAARAVASQPRCITGRGWMRRSRLHNRPPMHSKE